MEQKDYLLREVEKIGALLKMIFKKLISGDVNYSLALEKQFDQAKGQMINEIGFDLEKFLSLDKTETGEYIAKIEGFNVQNIELLADILKEVGLKVKNDISEIYLDKALQLYELCSSMDKTYSYDRENKIYELKNK